SSCITHFMSPGIFLVELASRGHSRSSSHRLALALPLRTHHGCAGHPFDSRHHIDGATYRPPPVARLLHEGPARQPCIGEARRCVAAEAATVHLEGQQLEPVLEPRQRDLQGRRNGHQWVERRQKFTKNTRAPWN